MGQVKVFCSHRSTDKAAVEAFARRLVDDGIEAWYDSWEIGPGDDFVAKMNEGLAACDAGLVFLSSQASSGPYLLAELSALQVLRIEDGKRLIPIVVDDGAEEFIRAQPLLRALNRRPIGDYEAVRDVLLDPGHRVGAPAALVSTVTEACVEVVVAPAGGVRVGLRVDGRDVCSEAVNRLPSGLALGRARSGAELEALGDRVGRVLFPGGVGERVSALIAELGVGRSLAFEVIGVLRGFRTVGYAASGVWNSWNASSGVRYPSPECSLR